MPTCPACGAERPALGFCEACGAAPMAPEQQAPSVQPRCPVPDDSYCAAHPATPAAITCSRCGSFACAPCAAAASGTGLCPACQALVVAPYVPWEHRRELGLFRAFWQTSKGLTLSPTEGWARVPRSGNVWDETSFLFAAAYAEQSGMTLFSVGVNVLSGVAAAGGAAADGDASGAVMLLVAPLFSVVSYLIFTPVQAIFNLCLRGGFEHLVLLALGEARGGFSGTYRAYCYSQAPGILGIVPVCGIFGAFFAQMYVRALGYMQIHGTTGTRAALAVCLPLLLCVVAVGGLLALMFGAIAAGGAFGSQG